jgi:hypothetical protein
MRPVSNLPRREDQAENAEHQRRAPRCTAIRNLSISAAAGRPNMNTSHPMPSSMPPKTALTRLGRFDLPFDDFHRASD